MNNIRTIEEYKEDVFDKLDEQQKLEWLYEMSRQINKAIEYIEENYPTSTINYQDDKYKLLQILGSDKE